MSVDLHTPPGRQHREQVLPALHDVFDRVLDSVTDGEEPPMLHPAADRVAVASEHNDAVATDDALGELAHAAIAARAELRSKHPDLGGTR